LRLRRSRSGSPLARPRAAGGAAPRNPPRSSAPRRVPVVPEVIRQPVSGPTPFATAAHARRRAFASLENDWRRPGAMG